MKYTLLAATTALSVCLSAGMVTAQDMSKDDALELSRQADTVREENAYNYEFNRDEQCQGYFWGVKRLGYDNFCDNDEEEVVVAADNEYEVLNEYVVYFDFDKSNIRQSDMDVISRASNDITKYNPRQVLVAGYTDTSGSMTYNEALSARRANAVSNALTNRGVTNMVVDEKALGETELAVPTGDGVKLQQNRRVVIQFVR